MNIDYYMEQIEQEFETLATTNNRQGISALTWPRWRPLEASVVDHFEAVFETESSEALYYKNLGNAAYKLLKFRKARKYYLKALCFFSNARNIVNTQFIEGFLPGLSLTAANRPNASPLSMLAGVSDTIVKEIYSYFFTPGVERLVMDMIPRRIISEIYGNLSIVSRKLKEPSAALGYALLAKKYDCSYQKSVGLEKTALEAGALHSGRDPLVLEHFVIHPIPHLSISTEGLGNKLRRYAKIMLKNASFVEEKLSASEDTVGMLHAQHFDLLKYSDLFIHPLQYAVVEQYFTRRLFHTLKAKLFGANTGLIQARFVLSIIPLPMKRKECPRGQYLRIQMFLPGQAMPQLFDIHTRCVDHENGENVTSAYGSVSRRGLMETLNTIEDVSRQIKEDGFDVVELHMSNCLQQITGPADLNDSLRSYRKDALGSSQEAIHAWEKWDKFSKDLAIISGGAEQDEQDEQIEGFAGFMNMFAAGFAEVMANGGDMRDMPPEMENMFRFMMAAGMARMGDEDDDDD